MKRKVKSLERLTKVQRMIHELARHKHKAAEIKKASLEQKQAEVLGALGGTDLGFGPIAAVASKYARRLDMEITSAAHDVVRYRQESIREGGKAKAAKELLRDARKMAGDRTLRAELAEIIDALAKGTPQAQEQD